MDKNKKTASNLIGGAGILMTISGILMAVSGQVPVAGVFWASASCMFLAARRFAIAAEKTNEEKQNRDKEDKDES